MGVRLGALGGVDEALRDAGDVHELVAEARDLGRRLVAVLLRGHHFRDVEDLLDAAAPTILKGFQDLHFIQVSKDYQNYLNATTLERGVANLASNADKRISTRLARLLEEAQQEGTISGFFARVYEGAVDEMHPLYLLVRRLLEYERMKKAAQGLDELPQVGRDVLAISVLVERTALERLPEVHPRDLAEVWRTLLVRARMTRHHRVSREELSVREHMSQILRRLREHRVLEFLELFEPARGVAVLVVTFLALLELARESLLDITQAEPYAPIYVRIAHAQPH